MTAAKKRSRPANDPYPKASQQIHFVALPRPFGRAQKIAAAAVLAGFVAIFALAIISRLPSGPQMPDHPAKTKIAPQTKAPEPYDIRLNASELTPTDEAMQLAGQLPVDVMMPKVGQRALSPVMQITVHGNNEDETPSPSAAALAQNFARQGDLKHAIQQQTRAVAEQPNNMLYRLQLAILEDRAADKQAAAQYYQQVVQAYDDHDATLPPTVAIDGIRSRLAYLTASR